ncbi:MAG: glycosyltransferase [Caldithrix sp.]|nr:glycosyltransferase [Caldithrix sp.]
MAKRKMKILHLDTVMEWRGGQQQVAYLLKGLNEQNVDIGLVCQPESPLQKYIETTEIPTFAIERHNNWDVTAARRVGKLIRKYEFHIIHAHSSHDLNLALLCRLMNSDIKIINTRRVDFSVHKPLIGTFKYNNSLVDKIVCISGEIRRILIRDGIPAHRLTVIPSGIDRHRLEHVAPLADFYRRYNIPESHVIIGTVAALADHKDYPTLLQAAKRVLSKKPNITFCAVGKGPLEKKIKSQAEQLGLSKQFVFTDFQENVGAFLKRFDIFVLASKMEGMGTSILDAQSVGLPVVATRAGGIPEMIEDGHNGILVDIQNPKALADALLELIAQPGLRKQMGQQALQTVKRFDIINTVRQYKKLYQELLDK